MKKTWVARMLGFGLVFAAVGCADRTHLTASHGRSVAASVAAQTANPGAGRKARTLPGFGAQESSIVAKNYRDSLKTKGQASEDKGMLILAAPQGSNQQQAPLAPSVPDHR